jgi:hypothetical protein
MSGHIRYSNQLCSWIVKYWGGNSGNIHVGTPPPGVSANRMTPEAPLEAGAAEELHAASRAAIRPTTAAKTNDARLRRAREPFGAAVTKVLPDRVADLVREYIRTAYGSRNRSI